MMSSSSTPTANPPCTKRLGSVSQNEPAPKRPPTPLEDKEVESEVRATPEENVKACSDRQIGLLLMHVLVAVPVANLVLF